MQNRKDLLQAHRLMTQRSALALICGEPDSPNQPSFPTTVIKAGQWFSGKTMYKFSVK